MSRSIHQTNKSVLYGKSESELQKMFDGNDHDVEELLKKKSYKKVEASRRKNYKQSVEFDQVNDEDEIG